MTPAMKKRTEFAGAAWKDEGDGYYSAIGSGVMGAVAYVALPPDHPDVGKDYDDLDGPEVNGGLTFAEDNVFGWGYAHLQNYSSPSPATPFALRYFCVREKRNTK